MRELRTVRTVLTAPLTRRTWAQAAYCLLSFVPALVGFVLIVVVALALGSAFTLTVLGAVPGILFLVAGLALARGLGALQRRLARGLIGERVEEPPRPDARRGLVVGVEARLRDSSAWRAVAYVLVKLPLATLGLYAVLWWVIGAINVIAPLRWAAGQRDMALLHPLPGGGQPPVHSLEGAFAAAAVGCAILLIAPWLTRAVVAVDRRLLHALLGPSLLAERVRDLEETRALAVDDAAEQLRRLERNLHDGAQVRLAALAMSLDMVREQLDDRDRPELHRLVETARDNATETLTELRDLSRGLHPPALDGGLADALITLAARAGLPVDVSVDVPNRPTPAIESLAYYCAAELLANVIKHSGARHCGIELSTGDGTLRMRVRDDGRGGAHIAEGGGLAGLVQRARTVDGDLTLHSPDGGPTTLTVRLPLHA
ncbi:sensor histidine kinase [Streptomyces himalayensis]|uniref:histidine kinase n=1 Tax=Streptomyces himalayensis subsp. himalayensis TaxID=2756131 RepID=A0A7W0ICT1_9ACTN|nr:sensor histidine kinase [Streptomyces himalayensis]MBA2950975.1 sensor domain-containing protein [Streptomyces himalayensis subsp. himalayensis]